jgi:hypothetical protein
MVCDGKSIEARVGEVAAALEAAARRAGRAPGEIVLMAAVKGRTAEEIEAAARAGVSCFGENRVQEGEGHARALGPDFFRSRRFHFIGRLQANKARRALRLFHSLDSVDSEDLALRLSRIAAEENLQREVMLEVNLGEESQKGGVAPEGAVTLARRVLSLPNLRLTGLLGVPPFDHDPEASRPHFRRLRSLFEEIADLSPQREVFRWLSMGMSHDFEVAVEEGATLVRLGTALFGPREA